MEQPLLGLTVAAALGCGLVAGAFFVFSLMVMPALRTLPWAQGLAAMQAVNVAAVRPLFMLALFGTALLCAGLGVVAVIRWDEPYAVWLLAGSLLYLVGSILLTGTYHVPRNDALARVDTGDAAAEEHWRRYLRDWTTWNHVRAAASLAAAAALTVGALSR